MATANANVRDRPRPSVEVPKRRVEGAADDEIMGGVIIRAGSTNAADRRVGPSLAGLILLLSREG